MVSERGADVVAPGDCPGRPPGGVRGAGSTCTLVAGAFRDGREPLSEPEL